MVSFSFNFIYHGTLHGHLITLFQMKIMRECCLFFFIFFMFVSLINLQILFCSSNMYILHNCSMQCILKRYPVSLRTPQIICITISSFIMVQYNKYVHAFFKKKSSFSYNLKLFYTYAELNRCNFFCVILNPLL